MSVMYSQQLIILVCVCIYIYIYIYTHTIQKFGGSVRLIISFFKGSYDAIWSFAFFLECYKLIVHRYSLSKLRLCHAPLKWLIQTRPHMSTSRCGNIFIIQPKCSRKGGRHGFSNCECAGSVDAGSHDRETLCVSRRKQKHFIWPSESRCI